MEITVMIFMLTDTDTLNEKITHHFKNGFVESPNIKA